MEISEIKIKISELNAQIQVIQDEAKTLFKQEVKKLMQEQGIASIEIRINNYAFNDGEPEYWSLYYDSMTLTFCNGDEFDGYGEKKDQYKSIHNKMYDFFKEFDNDDFYEQMFGPECDDSECSIAISADSEVLK